MSAAEHAVAASGPVLDRLLAAGTRHNCSAGASGATAGRAAVAGRLPGGSSLGDCRCSCGRRRIRQPSGGQVRCVGDHASRKCGSVPTGACVASRHAADDGAAAALVIGRGVEEAAAAVIVAAAVALEEEPRPQLRLVEGLQPQNRYGFI